MKIFLYSLVTLLLVLVAAYFIFLRPQLRIGAGYAAKHACSCHVIQGRELADILREDLNFSILSSVRLRPAENGESVTASFWGVVSRTAYRQGLGCVLLNDDDRPLPPMLPQLSQLPAVTDNRLGSDTSAVTTESPFDTAALRAAVDYGMAPVAGGGARGIVVVRHDSVIFEAYGPGYDRDTRLLGWSMTKSLTNTVIGMLVGEGKLDVQSSFLFPQWAKDERSAITLTNLLQMSSGLEWDESYGGVTDATRMLHTAPDMSAYARAKPAASPPDSVWAYSSGTTNLLVRLAAEQFAGPAAFQYYLYDSLFSRIGATSFVVETDQAGRPVGSSYGWATARDWAKLGQLYLRDGIWAGERILPAGWIKFSTTPAPAAPDRDYGAQIWLPGPDMPNAPADLFMFRGFQDQRVFVLPSLDAVVVRLGHNDDKTADFDGFLSRVVKALE